MNAYAVIQTGGKQYRVSQGDVLEVERITAAAGSEIDVKPVLAVSNGTDLAIGRPEVEQASVKAVILQHIRGPKVVSFKMKRRKGYHRKKGHRQELTVLKIKEIKH